jgi:hypothetical protein
MPLTAQVKQWATPCASNPNEMETLESWNRRQALNKEKHRNGNGSGTPLAIQIQQWPTPLVGLGEKSHGQMSGQFRREMSAKMGINNAKLNPRWVETLMGLPVGWTMPSCTSPVTIEPTNSDSSATG